MEERVTLFPEIWEWLARLLLRVLRTGAPEWRPHTAVAMTHSKLEFGEKQDRSMCNYSEGVGTVIVVGLWTSEEQVEKPIGRVPSLLEELQMRLGGASRCL